MVGVITSGSSRFRNGRALGVFLQRNDDYDER